MKIKLLLCVILVPCTFGFAKGKAEVRDVTGCLSKGDSAKEFLLTGNDGSTWEVRSSRVALSKHVGHTVTATGVVSHAKMHNMKEDAKEMAKMESDSHSRTSAMSVSGVLVWSSRRSKGNLLRLRARLYFAKGCGRPSCLRSLHPCRKRRSPLLS